MSRGLEELKTSAENTIANLQSVDEDMTEDKKNDNASKQLVTFNLPKNKYLEYKKMFGAEGLSFAQGSRVVLDYIYHEIQDGNLTITLGGIRKTFSNRIR